MKTKPRNPMGAIIIDQFPNIRIADLQAAMGELKRRKGICTVQGCNKKPEPNKFQCSYHIAYNAGKIIK